MKKPLTAGCLILFCARMFSLAQGTMTISFDGSPQVSRGSGIVAYSYLEAGYFFVGNSDGFIRNGGGGTLTPDNGTAYLQASAGDTLTFSNLNSRTFGLTSIDLAGYGVVVPDFSVAFIGYRPDGTTVSQTFSGNGIAFRTFYFGPEFSNLSRVEVPTWPWSMDNLVISVPEPATCALTLAEAVTLLLCRVLARRQMTL